MIGDHKLIILYLQQGILPIDAEQARIFKKGVSQYTMIGNSYIKGLSLDLCLNVLEQKIYNLSYKRFIRAHVAVIYEEGP